MKNLSQRQSKNKMMLTLTGFFTVLALSVLFFILGYIGFHGASAINWDFITKLPKPVGETGGGIANAIVTPDVYERNRILLTSGRFLMIEGILQNQDNVISVKARRIHSLSVTAAETESHDFH